MHSGRTDDLATRPPADAPVAGDRSRSSARPDWRAAARVLLAALLLGVAIYMLSNYLRALVWAVVLAIALWPLYARVRARAPGWTREIVLPGGMTALVGLVFILPFVVLAVEAFGEAHQLIDYGKRVEQSGMPAPAFIAHLPYGSKAVGDWWTAHLAHAGWFKETAQKIDTASNRELGRNLGRNIVHRVVLFGFGLLTLFFLFREGEGVIAQCRTASAKTFGPRGERVGNQMIASVHGTVNGLVLVGIGEGALLGVVYYFAGVPHAVLFGALTAVAAMIPFAAAIAFGLAALLLLASGKIVGAIVVVAAGVLVTFTADHFVRPSLIGGATKLPFLWVLLGILGGVETFGLLGLFVGPAIMAALILLWREFTQPNEVPATV